MAPVREANNKRYYVSREEYSADTYPAYCSGGGYVLSMDVVRDHLLRVVPLRACKV